LVAALDVPDEHGRAGDLLEAARNLIYRPDHELLRVLELHVVERAVEEGHWEGWFRESLRVRGFQKFMRQGRRRDLKDEMTDVITVT